ncbi:cytochrome P450 [Streptomyces sp. NPDC048179]|uniref:cytochrome P450 n=1 Tax=Streptomyces sp. NPDC048179 TaxID=3365506 RepID=UPI00371DE77E
MPDSTDGAIPGATGSLPLLGERSLPPGAFLPWAAGRHQYIGDRFAVTELITALATLLRRVRLVLDPGRTVRPVARPADRFSRPSTRAPPGGRDR